MLEADLEDVQELGYIVPEAVEPEVTRPCEYHCGDGQKYYSLNSQEGEFEGFWFWG